MGADRNDRHMDWNDILFDWCGSLRTRKELTFHEAISRGMNAFPTKACMHPKRADIVKPPQRTFIERFNIILAIANHMTSTFKPHLESHDL